MSDPRHRRPELLSKCLRPRGRGRQWRSWRREQDGASLVEFALVFPIFVLVILGLVSFGMMLALKQGVTNAAADGARSVVGVVDNTATPAVDERIEKARTTVANRLSWLGGNASYLVTDVKWYNSASATCEALEVGVAPPSPPTICVKITYPYDDHKLVPAPTFGVSTLSSEARVQVGS